MQMNVCSLNTGMVKKIFTYTRVDNPYVVSFGLSICKIFGIYFIEVQFSLNAAFPRWSSAIVAQINDWDGGIGGIVVSSLSGNAGTFMLSVNQNGEITVSTHGEVSSIAWYYGCGVFF